MLPPNLIDDAIHTAKIERELELSKLDRIGRLRPSGEPRERTSLRLPRILATVFTRRVRPTPVAVTAEHAGR
jgi:hypothetical protein